LFGTEPEVKVMHAGLECGIIQGVYPEMDMISIGPDIQFPHSPGERVNIASVEKIWRLIVDVLEKI
jgi:dipeptidase D